MYKVTVLMCTFNGDKDKQIISIINQKKLMWIFLSLMMDLQTIQLKF